MSLVPGIDGAEDEADVPGLCTLADYHGRMIVVHEKHYSKRDARTVAELVVKETGERLGGPVRAYCDAGHQVTFDFVTVDRWGISAHGKGRDRQWHVPGQAALAVEVSDLGHMVTVRTGERKPRLAMIGPGPNGFLLGLAIQHAARQADRPVTVRA